MILKDKMINRIFRSLPDFKGKQRLGRLIFKNEIKNLKNIIVKGKYNINYLLPNLNENIAYEIFINGIYEKPTIDFIISKIPEGGIYIDIGANIGSITIPVYTQKNNITAICVEAAPSVYQYLKENCNKFNNIILINNAVSDGDGKIVSFYSPKNQFGKGHLTKDINEENINVSTIRLDTLLKNYNISNPDFIKIDIEGYEFYAFKGAEDLLALSNAPDILFEFEDWAEERAFGLKAGDAQLFLLKKGYTLFILNNGKLNKLKIPKLKGSAMIYATKKRN